MKPIVPSRVGRLPRTDDPFPAAGAPRIASVPFVTRRRGFRRWATKAFVERAVQLHNTHTIADGVYVALVQGLATPLITCDGLLAQSHGHEAEIELIA